MFRAMELRRSSSETFPATVLASEFGHPGTPGHVSFICRTVTFLNCLGYGNTAHGTVSETAEAVRLGKWDNTLEVKTKIPKLEATWAALPAITPGKQSPAQVSRTTS